MTIGTKNNPVPLGFLEKKNLHYKGMEVVYVIELYFLWYLIEGIEPLQWKNSPIPLVFLEKNWTLQRVGTSLFYRTVFLTIFDSRDWTISVDIGAKIWS